MDKAKTASYFSESLARGLQVVCAFANAEKLRIAEVVQHTGLSRAAVRRYLLTLQDLGYIGCDGDWFYLKPRVLELGYGYKSSASLSILAEAQVIALADRTREASTFAVLDRTDVLVVTRATKRSWDLTMRAGNRMPVLSTSLGHVLLAWLPPTQLDQIADRCGLSKSANISLRKNLLLTKKNGFSYMVREEQPQFVAIAVPIMDRHQKVVGALNITSAPMLSKAAAVRTLLPLLEDAKLQIEAGLKSINVAP